MKILLIFTLCLISDGGDSKEVTGYSGGGVLIKCKYHTVYTKNNKYFCKGPWLTCTDQIKPGPKNESGRFLLYDDTKSEFWVMIRELTIQDNGTYQCGVDIKSWIDIYTPVKLKVNKDLYYNKSISETVHVGGDLNISCKYPESLRSNLMFLCMMSLQDFACTHKRSVNESREYINMGNLSLYDDRANKILSVSIRNVTERDSGEYWCGAEVAWESDHGYKVYFTQINLTVTVLDPHVPVSTLEPTQPPSSSSSSSSASSSSILLSSSQSPSSSSSSSFLLPLSSPSLLSTLLPPHSSSLSPLPLSSSSSSSSSSLSLLLLSSSQSAPASPPAGVPASTVIPVSVTLLLLPIGITFLTLTLQMRRKMK
ncbi:polymeric immunoglobulin receptor-like isoform X4, partial [Clarias magur]